MKASVLREKLNKGESVRIERNKGEYINISAPEGNFWGTRFSIDVDYYEPGARYSHFSYSKTYPSVEQVINEIIKELKERKIVK
jgi:effector-binding domain-containing protein